MWQYNHTNDELYHYGVLGMKWGVRKALKGNSEYKKAKKQYNKDFNAAVKAAKKTKSFAITQKGKAKKAKLDEDYSNKYEQMVRSKNKVDKIRNNAKKLVMRELKDKYAKKIVSELDQTNKRNGKSFVEDIIYGTLDPNSSNRRQKQEERFNKQRTQVYDPLQYSRKYGNKRGNI